MSMQLFGGWLESGSPTASNVQWQVGWGTWQGDGMPESVSLLPLLTWLISSLSPFPSFLDLLISSSLDQLLISTLDQLISSLDQSTSFPSETVPAPMLLSPSPTSSWTIASILISWAHNLGKFLSKPFACFGTKKNKTGHYHEGKSQTECCSLEHKKGVKRGFIITIIDRHNHYHNHNHNHNHNHKQNR